ncbi:bifunctional hydroxymethylpyrimidine kinase/phosphomethylpyrimidine kinase [Streptococcus iniae]|uniref:bifunctional hydroxymethylpyrimidine kinase/phosphomethylpyrimidine kinase n=1 Tax=Streptococcus iniae TaxID=1346 RepID=UPI001CD1E843|nr:bifunctional hydroxymethylpyrimidine kinase/phosphomethylpyrimidine kinase [Streptococcus iniae]MCA1357339.1 bifunctional hydroxymethylpyrimidine kinase/phosphomethylpyrimidine kinase [Streptococcus iniae]
MSNQYILAISGNDIFSGGGLHADLTTFTTSQLHGFLALTCLTAMTEKGFEVFPTDETVFNYQLDSLSEVPFSAIKIGLLPTPSLAKQTLRFIKTKSHLPIVLDPVLVCKESHDVEVNVLRDDLIAFFPYVSIITPNLVEAELLSQKTIKTIEDMKEAAQILYKLGAKQIVIKGGNRFSQEKAIDLFYDGNIFELLDYPILSQNNIGAGCTFASSIASHLAQEESSFDAVKEAKDFVYQAIIKADDYGVKQFGKTS